MTIQVEDIKRVYQNHSRDTCRTFHPLTYLLKLFAINCDIEDERTTRVCIARCLCTMAVLGSLIIYSLYYKMEHVYFIMSPSVALTDVVQVCFDYCQYVVDFWFVWKYGTSISKQYFRHYETIDQILGMTDYTVIKKKVKKMIGIFLLIWLASSSCDFAAWTLSYDWPIPMYHAVAYIFLLIKILTTLDLSSHVMHIEARLKIIADVVQYQYHTARCLPGPASDFITNEQWIHTKDKADLNLRSNPKKCKLLDDECRDLARCYLQLTEQVYFINRMFGLRILLNSLSLLIDIIRFTNLAIRIILKAQQTTYNSGYFLAASTLTRQVACVVVLVRLVQHCERAYCQRARILATADHLLLERDPEPRVRAVMSQLQAFVAARPISFSLARFFTLDNNFLVSVASVAVTYTIILLQSMN